MTDVGLLGCRLHNGDQTVLSEVLRLYWADLARELLREFDPLLQSADVDDVLSIALHQLWWSRKSFNCGHPVSPWFRHIVFNVARNLVKSQRRAVRQCQTLTDPELMDRLPCRESPSRESLDAANPDFVRVLLALQTLPHAFQRIMLADADDPTGVAPSDVLARELGLSPSTVREYRRRAPGRVRRILEGEERERERDEGICSDAQCDGEL